MVYNFCKSYCTRVTSPFRGDKRYWQLFQSFWRSSHNQKSWTCHCKPTRWWWGKDRKPISLLPCSEARDVFHKDAIFWPTHISSRVFPFQASNFSWHRIFSEKNPPKNKQTKNPKPRSSTKPSEIRQRSLLSNWHMTSLKIKAIAIHELKREMGKTLLFYSHIEFAFAIGKLLCIFIKYCLYLKRTFLFITW